MLRLGVILALTATMMLTTTLPKADPADQSVMVLFEADIVPGKSDDVSALVHRMVAFNQADEPETLIYKAFLSEDSKRLTFMETYSDTGGMLFHDERFMSTFADQLFELTKNPRLCIYGPVSPIYKRFAEEAGFKIEYANLISGFSR